MSSFKQRVDALDDCLSPTEIVLRWLQEVVGFPSADDYVASIKDRPRSAWPLHRLTQEAERAATASSKGMPRDAIHGNVREDARGSDAALAWMRACHELPYPLDLETAAAVEAALEHRVESWNLLREAETVEEWVLAMLPEDDDEVLDGDDSDADVAAIARGVERELRRLVGSNVVRAAGW